LAILYYGTGGETWNRKSGWLGNGNHCDWDGVNGCNTDGLVSSISLNANNLIGAVPDLNLPALQSLYLGNNALSVIPNFSYLGALQFLILDKNALSAIPNFRNLLALREVDLNGNPLVKSIPQSLCDRRRPGGIVTIRADIVLSCDPEPSESFHPSSQPSLSLQPSFQPSCTRKDCTNFNTVLCEIASDALGCADAFADYAEAVTWFLKEMHHPNTMIIRAQLEVRICI